MGSKFSVVFLSLSHVQLFATPWTVVHQAPLSMGFPRLEYESELPFPAPRDLPDRDETCVSCLGRWILYHSATRGALAIYLGR